MTGHRVTAGLSLLCALVFCAFAAPSAQAVPSGTAYFECGSGLGALDFSDSHCKTKVAPGTGTFGHKLIAAGSTEVELTNTEGAVFKGTVGGVAAELTATTFTSEATTVENTTVGEAMTGKGVGSGKYTGVVVVKPEKCSVTGGEIKQLSTTSTTEQSGAEMWVQFAPKAPGTTFAEFEMSGAECALKGQKLKVTGTAKGLPEGATLKFTTASTSGLKLAGNVASLTTTLTTRMKAAGNPVALTTTP